MRPPKKRPRSHVLETESRIALSKLIHQFGWVYRNIHDQDYGIDGQIEIFSKDGGFGTTFSVQIKSTSEPDIKKALRNRLSKEDIQYLKGKIEPVLVVLYLSDRDEFYYIWSTQILTKNSAMKKQSQSFEYFKWKPLSITSKSNIESDVSIEYLISKNGLSLPVGVEIEFGDGLGDEFEVELYHNIISRCPHSYFRFTKNRPLVRICITVDCILINFGLKTSNFFNFNIGETSPADLSSDIWCFIGHLFHRLKMDAIAENAIYNNFSSSSVVRSIDLSIALMPVIILSKNVELLKSAGKSLHATLSDWEYFIKGLSLFCLDLDNKQAKELSEYIKQLSVEINVNSSSEASIATIKLAKAILMLDFELCEDILKFVPEGFPGKNSVRARIYAGRMQYGEAKNCLSLEHSDSRSVQDRVFLIQLLITLGDIDGAYIELERLECDQSIDIESDLDHPARFLLLMLTILKPHIDQLYLIQQKADKSFLDCLLEYAANDTSNLTEFVRKSIFLLYFSVDNLVVEAIALAIAWNSQEKFFEIIDVALSVAVFTHGYEISARINQAMIDLGYDSKSRLGLMKLLEDKVSEVLFNERIVAPSCNLSGSNVN